MQQSCVVMEGLLKLNYITQVRLGIVQRQLLHSSIVGSEKILKWGRPGQASSFVQELSPTTVFFFNCLPIVDNGYQA